MILRFPWEIPYRAGPSLESMEGTPRRQPARSGRRDDDVRAVSRTTKAVVGVAVIGVGAFAGLAATGQTHATSAVRSRTAASDGGATTQGQGSGASTDNGLWQEQVQQQEQQAPTYDGYQQSLPSDQGVTPPQSTPSSSQLPPVAGTGGS